MLVNNTWMASLAFWFAAASVAAGTAGNGETRRSSGPAAPCGIYALDSRGGAHRDANIRDYPFVEGYVLRPSWSELEPQAGAYDFTMIDAVVKKLQAIGKKLSLEMMRPPEPAYLVERSGALTWFDTWRDLNTVRPAPWDPYTLERFKALARAMAEHPVPDSTKGGTKTRLRDHPVLANINFGIPGAHAAIRSPVQFRLIDMPGYTREKFKSAVLESLYAMTGNFPAKAAYIGFWTVQDGQSPALWEDIQSAIHSEFDGIRNPRVGFFQENLAAS